MKLLGDGCAADQVAPFEDQDFAPRPREIRGVHETVMPAANDDDVVIHACSNRTLRRKQNAGNLVRRARELRGRRFGSRAGKASTWLHSTPAGRSGSTNLFSFAVSAFAQRRRARGASSQGDFGVDANRHTAARTHVSPLRE